MDNHNKFLRWTDENQYEYVYILIKRHGPSMIRLLFTENPATNNNDMINELTRYSPLDGDVFVEVPWKA